MTAYYNEHDPFAADWLENLIWAEQIAPGVVDRRSIEDVTPNDLKGFTQCHFFAGIGVWSYALRQAGWSDDRPVWTGSCPCQPFSAAGKSGGFDDERHLWPALHYLAEQCRPSVLFGEQVSSKDGLAWLDLVQTDMEATGYAFGALDLCAAGIGAPHIRQRSFWLADDELQQRQEPRTRTRIKPTSGGRDETTGSIAGLGGSSGLDDADSQSRQWNAGSLNRSQAQVDGKRVGVNGPSRDGRCLASPTGRLAHGDNERRGVLEERDGWPLAGGLVQSGADVDGCGGLLRSAGPTNGYWRDADWLGCRDGKWRPVEPGTFPLANGASNRVGALRGYGNAIVAPLATQFIEIAMEHLS